MRSRALPLLVLVGALAGLVSTVGWAATRDGDHGWMMQRSGMWMSGYAAEGGKRVNDLAEASAQAQRFADRFDLRVGEVMRFSNHYYAELEEQDGRPATEVLVDPAGGVFLEYGPAMMWNTRYGMMRAGMMGVGTMGRGMMSGGMMGGGAPADPTWTPGTAGEVGPAEARALASRWLRGRGGGLTAGEPEAFPGYYTLHVLRDGRIAGMLSVSAATGAVWSHWWHGRFVSVLDG